MYKIVLNAKLCIYPEILKKYSLFSTLNLLNVLLFHFLCTDNTSERQAGAKEHIHDMLCEIP